MKDIRLSNAFIDKKTGDLLNDYCKRKGITIEQFVFDAVAEKLEDDGEHFFWHNHSESKR